MRSLLVLGGTGLPRGDCLVVVTVYGRVPGSRLVKTRDQRPSARVARHHLLHAGGVEAPQEPHAGLLTEFSALCRRIGLS